MTRPDGFHVAPTSRQEIRQHARVVRDVVGGGARFPIVETLDIHLPRELPEFRAVYLSSSEMIERFGMGCEGMAFPDKNLIYINENVYYRACNEDGRARFSLAHELGHFFLHNGGGLARRAHSRTPIYCNSEWQANTFAAELLIDSRLTQLGDRVADLMERFGVSYSAAVAAWSQLSQEGRI